MLWGYCPVTPVWELPILLPMPKTRLVLIMSDYVSLGPCSWEKICWAAVPHLCSDHTTRWILPNPLGVGKQMKAGGP